MSIRWLVVPVVALLLIGPGCGGNSGSGGGPTQASGFLTVNVPTDVIKVGATQTVAATMTRGGAPTTVTPAWRVDNPAIGTIDASGLFTAIAHGEVTIIAEYQGASDAKKIRVVNDYGLTWYGNYLVTRCAATGRFGELGWCDADGFAPGQTSEMAMELQQDRDAVTGTFWLGGTNGPFTGSVATGGNLTGEAKFTYTYDDGGVLDILVSPLSVLREGQRVTQGTFTVVFSMVGVRGGCTFDARVLGLDQVTGGRAGLRLVPGTPRTMRDVLRLIRQK